jgi:hypothetical protein
MFPLIQSKISETGLEFLLLRETQAQNISLQLFTTSHTVNLSLTTTQVPNAILTHPLTASRLLLIQTLRSCHSQKRTSGSLKPLTTRIVQPLSALASSSKHPSSHLVAGNFLRKEASNQAGSVLLDSLKPFMKFNNCS